MGESRIPGTTGEDFYCHQRNKGTLGKNDASDPTSYGFVAPDSRGSVGVNDHADPDLDAENEPAKLAAKVFVLDLERTSRLLNSTAFAIEQQAAIRVEWKEYEDSMLLNALYFFHDTKPGHADINFGNHQLIRAKTQDRYERLCDTLLTRMSEGPKQTIEYLEGLEKLRASALNGIRSTIADVQNINTGIINQTDKTIATLKMVKAGATIALAGLVIVYTGGAALGAGFATTTSGGLMGASMAKTVGSTYFAYEISVAVASTFSEGKDAMAIAVAKEGGEEWGEKMGEKLDDAGKAKLDQATQQSKRAKTLEGKIERQQNKLKGIKEKKANGKGKLSKRQQNRLSNRSARTRKNIKAKQSQLKISKQAGKNARLKGLVKRGAGVTLQLVFAANDVREAVGEFVDAFNDYQDADK